MLTLPTVGFLFLLSTAAGALTTVAGMGGGIVLVTILSAQFGPATALAVTGPALLLGNAHRFWRYRADVDRRVAGRYLLGGVPGAVLGGWALVAVSPQGLQWGIAALAGLALLRVASGDRWGLPTFALVPGGFATGFVTTTSGGGGLLASPMLMAAGLRGRSYIATAAAGAAAIHLCRIAACGVAHLLTPPVLILGGVAAAGMPLGNLLGERLRHHVSEELGTRIELGTVLVASAMAFAGLLS
jgi:uncharacterized membrane protein YfcA